MQEEERQEGMTLGELFRIVLKKIWILLGVSVAVALAGTAIMAFAVNPRIAKYAVDFSIVYPASDTLKYPDGSPFYYQDLVSENNLVAAKASDEAFAPIDVEKLVDENSIAITVKSAETGTVKTDTYTIEAVQSYFPNKDVATAFLRALARGPEARVLAAAKDIDFTIDEEVFSGSSFLAQLTLLSSQKENILSQYDAWIELFGGSYRNRETGKSLFTYRTEAATVCDLAALTSLTGELERGGYVPVKSIEDERKSLAAEYEINENIIETLRTLLADVPSSAGVRLAAVKEEPSIITEDVKGVSELLAEKVERNRLIEYRLGTKEGENWTGGALNETNVNAFVARVNEQYRALNGAAGTVATVSAAIYGQETYTRFDTPRAEEKGGMSSIFVAVALFVIAFVVGAVVVFFLENSRRARAKAAQASGNSAEAEKVEVKEKAIVEEKAAEAEKPAAPESPEEEK